MVDRKFLAVVRREYLERVRTRWFLIATIFGPVLFGSLMVLPALLAARDKGAADASNIVVIDATSTALGARVAARLAGGVTAGDHAPRVVPVTSAGIAVAESLATTDVMQERAKGYLVLDSSALTTGRARYAGNNTTAIFDMQRLERAVQRELFSLRLEEQGRGGSGQLNFFVGLAVAMTLYMTIFIYGLNVLRGVLEEKQTRVAEVVVASIPATRLLAGKVVGVGAVGLTQIVLWMVMGVVMYNLRAPILASFGVVSAPLSIPDVGMGTAFTLLGFFVLGFMFYAGLFAAVGATINSEQEAQQAQMPVVLLLVASVMFVQNILMQPDGLFSRVMSTLPFSAHIIMPLRMTVAPVPMGQVLLSLLSVGVGAAFTTWIAGRIYRVGLLMYGKRPTFREMMTWVQRT